MGRNENGAARCLAVVVVAAAIVVFVVTSVGDNDEGATSALSHAQPPRKIRAD
jgi:hypothetical protein